MIRTATISAVTAAVILSSLPLAGAEWLSYGTFEPDTSYDTSTWMWQEAPGAITNRVYFNVYPKWFGSGANGAVVNPNVGAAHTRLDPPGSTTFQAVLGIWVDCNRDGYIGLAETAAREYKAELLPANHICPLVQGSNAAWTAGAHNYNGWVTELIPIGGRDYLAGDDRRVYSDPDAMVWGDPGRPEDDAPQAGPSCPTFPLPGDSRSTGGIVYTIDCRGNRGWVAQFNELDATLGLGLGFGNDPRASSSPLNVETFGDDSSEHSAVHLQDCSRPALVNTGDMPAGSDLDNIDVIRAPPGNPVNTDVMSWTVPGTMNATRESITVIYETNISRERGSHPDGDCDYSNDRGNDFYGNIEGNAVINQEDGKRNAWTNFAFNTASRGTLPATALGAGRGMAATDFGIELLSAECTASSCVQSQWVGGGFSHQTPVFRGSLGDASVDGDETEFAGAPRWSFFAYVGPTTAARGHALPGGGQTEKYGQAQCGAFTSGEHHGWNCAAEDWYDLADGTNSQDTTRRPLAKVGQVYNLRDVDCRDGSLGDAGVGVSPSFFGTDAC